MNQLNAIKVMFMVTVLIVGSTDAMVHAEVGELNTEDRKFIKHRKKAADALNKLKNGNNKASSLAYAMTPNNNSVDEAVCCCAGLGITAGVIAGIHYLCGN